MGTPKADYVWIRWDLSEAQKKNLKYESAYSQGSSSTVVLVYMKELYEVRNTEWQRF